MISSVMNVAALASVAAVVLPALALPQKNSLQLRPRQQQSEGTPLFLDEPSCDSYQCATIFYPGDNATAHWLNAPTGNVVLTMLSHYSNMTDQAVATVPGTTTNCDAEGSGNTCGQFSWIVPSAWAGGNFTLQAQSASDSSVESYTDTILVMPGNSSSNSLNVPFKALDPTAANSSSTASSSSTTAAAASASNPLTTSNSTPVTTSAGGAASSTSAPAQTSSTAPASSSGSSSDAAGMLQTPLLLFSCTVAIFIAVSL